MSDQTVKYLLPEDRMPKSWYNIAADLPPMAPVLHPATGQPVRPAVLVPTPDEIRRATAQPA